MDERPKKRRGPLTWLAVLVGLPMLYVASFGPVCWINSREHIDRETVNVAYRPLLWAASRSKAVRPILWYAELAAGDGSARGSSFSLGRGLGAGGEQHAKALILVLDARVPEVPVR